LKEVGEPYDPGALVVFKREEMFVAAHDDVGPGKDRAFQDPIVRFITQNMETRRSFEDRRCLADGP
jgi:hypothetical protein